MSALARNIKMTTKPNPFTTGVNPNAVLKPRIIIEVDLAKGTSNLTTRGPLTVPGIIDVLLMQVLTMHRNWVNQSLGIIDPNAKTTQTQIKVCAFAGCQNHAIDDMWCAEHPDGKIPNPVVTQ